MKERTRQDLWDYVYSIKNTVISTCLKYVVSKYDECEFKKSYLKIKFNGFKFDESIHLKSKDNDFKVFYFTNKNEK